MVPAPMHDDMQVIRGGKKFIFLSLNLLSELTTVHVYNLSWPKKNSSQSSISSMGQYASKIQLCCKSSLSLFLTDYFRSDDGKRQPTGNSRFLRKFKSNCHPVYYDHPMHRDFGFQHGRHWH